MSHDVEPNLQGRVLPPGHRSRTDDLAYENVSAWFDDHQRRVPIQCAGALDRFMRTHGCTFAEAFTAVTRRGGPIILIE
jgi:hypothetical protein